MPYTLSVNAGYRGNLRMGAKVPVMMITAVASPVNGPDGKPMPLVGPISYQDVGTNIDCNVSPVQDDGRYRVEIVVDDTSVYPEDKPASGAGAGNPTFRSFRASDSMVLRDRQSAQFTTATDKVSGEIVKVDVTLTVVK